MDAESRRKNRRYRYGRGLVSSYFLETGEPLQEMLAREERRTRAIREQVIREEKQIDLFGDGYDIVFDDIC